MPRGDKSAYTDKQKRQAEHIEDSEGARALHPDRRADRMGHRQQAGRRRQEEAGEENRREGGGKEWRRKGPLRAFPGNSGACRQGKPARRLRPPVPA